MYTYPSATSRLASMKIFCKVRGKSAVIVGYGPGRKGRPRAIVITEGKLCDVALKDIELEGSEKLRPVPVQQIPRKSA